MALKVLIVGAGMSGLTTLKECLAAGFNATVFEAQDHIGGQWQYTDPDPVTGEVHSSIYQGTVFNSCRDTSSFSDFPMDPARYSVYTTHKQYVGYLHEYATFFDLLSHIRFRTKVMKCVQLEGGKWEVTYSEKEDIKAETYDALFACTGHNATPFIPQFEGMKDFKGQFIHSHVYRTPGAFEGKKVAVIGIGSSAVDISTELAPQAKGVHVITRTGGWIIPRFIFGKPVEAWDSRFAATVLPKSISTWAQTKLLNLVTGKLPPELKPKHGILEANPTVRGDFLEQIQVGRMTPHRAGVEKFTQNGVLLTNGTELEVDVIIACTGYLIEFPYLPEDSYKAKKSLFIDSPNSVNLYEVVVPPNYQNLFFIGIVELPGPLPPISEIQARWAVGILSKKFSLPTPEQMTRSIEQFQLNLAKNYVHSDRHTVSTDFLPYADRLLSPLHANPSFPRLFRQLFTGHPLRAFKVLWSVYMDVSSSGQFRLFGEGRKENVAVASILRIAEGGGELSVGEREALGGMGMGKVGEEGGLRLGNGVD